MLHIPAEIERKIENRAEHLADCLCHDLDEFASVDDMREALREIGSEDTLAIGLTTDHQIKVLEYFGDDHADGLLDSVTFGSLRGRIEGLAAYVIHAEAESQVSERLDEFEELLGDHDLDFSEIITSNHYGMFVHWDEEDAGDDCTVYKYRNVEGETHVDLYEFRFFGSTFYVRDYLDADDLSEEERTFQAS